VELAKYAATLDQMSGGRVILGVGAGAMPEEFLALGIPMRRRGSLTDESIAIMKELWTNPYPSYHSRRWEFSDLRFSPKPLQKPHIPLWVGGSSPGALRRTATQGDGWHPTGLSPEEFSMGRREVNELAAAAGRDPDGLTMSLRVELEMGEIPPNPPLQRGAGAITSARAANRARVPGNDPAAIIAAIEGYRSVGVEHLVLAPNSGAVPAITSVMEAIARRVMPHFR
jgi:alkanesulfonate monooxygenase SsuD/methylene tetrahydromethanopterin reductase-like flavin-dependent oxidoreductase (luciferase family)